MFELVFGSEAGSVIKNFDLLEPDLHPTHRTVPKYGTVTTASTGSVPEKVTFYIFTAPT